MGYLYWVYIIEDLILFFYEVPGQQCWAIEGCCFRDVYASSLAVNAILPGNVHFEK